MTENLHRKKNHKNQIPRFKGLDENFSLKSSSLLKIKVAIIILRIIFMAFLAFKLKKIATFFFFGIECIFGSLDFFTTLRLSSYNYLAQEVVDDYRRIEKIQREICDLEMDRKTREELQKEEKNLPSL